ncbi:MAG: hypothetical protein ACREHG_08455 [Candidatus Saccharimonadales bacterium]
MENEDKPQQQPSKGYGKHSKWFWVLVYLIIAIIVYGVIYLLVIHKSGNGSTSGNGGNSSNSGIY